MMHKRWCCSQSYVVGEVRVFLSVLYFLLWLLLLFCHFSCGYSCSFVISLVPIVTFLLTEHILKSIEFSKE